MKVLGINGSLRKDGNTAILIQTVFKIASGGIILGSPVYSAGVTSQMKALIDR